MKPIVVPTGLATLPAALVLLTASNLIVSAENLMLDFGPTAVATPYLTLSPGHDAGRVPASETTWNQITTSAKVTSLNWSNGTSATGVTLTMGQGLKSSATITYTDAVSFVGSIAGDGGSAAGQEKLTTTKGASIYGSGTTSTAVGRDALFANVSDTIIGFRVDGLAAGDYIVYVMARNTNTNVRSGAGMNAYASAAVSSSTFNYSTLLSYSHANLGYAAATYANEFDTFADGNNHVAIPVTVTADQSVFVAVEGQGTGGTGGGGRGFINMIQIVEAVDTPFSLWMDEFKFDIPNAADRLPGADPDGDGVSNIIEFAFGGQPADSTKRGTRLVQTADTDGDTKSELILTLEVRSGAVFQAAGSTLVSERDGISYTIEGALDLALFDSPVTEVSPHRGTGTPTDGYEFKTFRLSASNGLEGKGFLRAKAVATPAP